MTRDDLLAAAVAIRATASERDPTLAEVPIVAIGWATVDHERAMAELDAAVGADAEPWLALPRDAAMGASARVRSLGEGAPTLVVLEPDTEGGLAASLVRFGEGVAVVYLDAASGAAAAIQGRRVPGGPAWGPHVVVLEDRETTP
jgi:hypothetical protein